MGLFHKDNVIEWYQKNGSKSCFTGKGVEKGKEQFRKCAMVSSQNQLLEFVMTYGTMYNTIAVEYMDDEHLIRYACRAPEKEKNGFITPKEEQREDAEVYAVKRIHYSESLVKLYNIYKNQGTFYYSSPGYASKYGVKRREALTERIGEKEAILIVQEMLARNETVNPEDWIATRITDQAVRKKLGLMPSKEELIERYKESSTPERALLLRELLNDAELVEVLRNVNPDVFAEEPIITTINDESFLFERLYQGKYRRNQISYIVSKIKNKEYLRKLLLNNPIYDKLAICVINEIDDLDILIEFRDKVYSVSDQLYNSPSYVGSVPDPSDDNLIILRDKRDSHFTFEAWNALIKRIHSLDRDYPAPVELVFLRDYKKKNNSK